MIAASATSTDMRRMPVPPSRRTGPLVLYALVLFFVSVAIYDLVNAASMPSWTVLASIAWLVLVVLLLTASIREAGGLRRYVIHRLGEFSKHQFVKAERRGSDPVTIGFGYGLFGCEFFYLKVAGPAVVSVEWSSGQATAMAGRDMNDWHVAVWYRHSDGPQRPHHPGVRDEEVYIVGPSGRKEAIESFGRSLVAFLRDAGIDLAPGTCPTDFRVSGHPTAS